MYNVALAGQGNTLEVDERWDGGWQKFASDASRRRRMHHAIELLDVIWELEARGGRPWT